MAKVSTNIALDSRLKKSSQELFADLGMDLTTAVTIFLKQCVRTQGFPFSITRDVPNAETLEALNEYYSMKEHPEQILFHLSSMIAYIHQLLADYPERHSHRSLCEE